jgi:hypothetical protein
LAAFAALFGNVVAFQRVDLIQFPANIRTKGAGLRTVVRTMAEAIRLIDEELPAELRAQPRWTFARSLLVVAERSRKKRDVVPAIRQFKQALDNEGWLNEN